MTTRRRTQMPMRARLADEEKRNKPIVTYVTPSEYEVAGDIALMEADRSGSGVMRRALAFYVEVKYPSMVKRLREDLRPVEGGTK
jgi:acyl-CoA synthetase (NDP forming)